MPSVCTAMEVQAPPVPCTRNHNSLQSLTHTRNPHHTQLTARSTQHAARSTQLTARSTQHAALPSSYRVPVTDMVDAGGAGGGSR